MTLARRLAESGDVLHFLQSKRALRDFLFFLLTVHHDLIVAIGDALQTIANDVEFSLPWFMRSVSEKPS